MDHDRLMRYRHILTGVTVEPVSEAVAEQFSRDPMYRDADQEEIPRPKRRKPVKEE